MQEKNEIKSKKEKKEERNSDLPVRQDAQHKPAPLHRVRENQMGKGRN